jgi:hypothetical protein
VQLFKKGVKPEWEDAANANGGEWTVRKPFDLRSGELDTLWENLVRRTPRLVCLPTVRACDSSASRR